jgi:hypothetical protein
MPQRMESISRRLADEPSAAWRQVSSGGRDVEADGCGHDEDGGAEFCD